MLTGLDGKDETQSFTCKILLYIFFFYSPGRIFLEKFVRITLHFLMEINMGNPDLKLAGVFCRSADSDATFFYHFFFFSSLFERIPFLPAIYFALLRLSIKNFPWKTMSIPISDLFQSSGMFNVKDAIPLGKRNSKKTIVLKMSWL